MTDELDDLDQSRTRSRIALADSEERFRQLVSGVEDYAIFLLDPTGTITTWNLGAERIKGYAPGDIIGRNFSVFYTPESAAQAWPQYELSVARETGRFSTEGWRVRKNGTQFWASVVISAIRAGDGSLRGFLKITRDLTERRVAKDALRERRLDGTPLRAVAAAAAAAGSRDPDRPTAPSPDPPGAPHAAYDSGCHLGRRVLGLAGRQLGLDSRSVGGSRRAARALGRTALRS